MKKYYNLPRIGNIQFYVINMKVLMYYRSVSYARKHFISKFNKNETKF